MTAILATMLLGVYALRWPILVVIVGCWTAARVADWLDQLEQQHTTTTRSDQDRNTR